MFLDLYEKGLVERRSAPVNWCVECDTVLANEQSRTIVAGDADLKLSNEICLSGSFL